MKRVEDDSESYSKKVAHSTIYNTNTTNSNKEIRKDFLMSLDQGELQ